MLLSHSPCVFFSLCKAYQRLQIQQQMMQAQRNVSGPIKQQEQQVWHTHSFFFYSPEILVSAHLLMTMTNNVNFHIQWKKINTVLLSPRLHVQSQTCSSRSSSTSVSWPRLCLWNSSSLHLLLTMACTRTLVRQAWTPSQVTLRLQASPPQTCRPKSSSLLQTPLALIHSVREQAAYGQMPACLNLLCFSG